MFIGDMTTGEARDGLRCLANFARLKLAKAFRDSYKKPNTDPQIIPYLNGKYKRGWVVVEIW